MSDLSIVPGAYHLLAPCFLQSMHWCVYETLSGAAVAGVLYLMLIVKVVELVDRYETKREDLRRQRRKETP